MKHLTLPTAFEVVPDAERYLTSSDDEDYLSFAAVDTISSRCAAMLGCAGEEMGR